MVYKSTTVFGFMVDLSPSRSRARFANVTWFKLQIPAIAFYSSPDVVIYMEIVSESRTYLSVHMMYKPPISKPIGCCHKLDSFILLEHHKNGGSTMSSHFLIHLADNNCLLKQWSCLQCVTNNSKI